MKKHSISTIVNFCTNESRFLQATLEQALLFSRQVIVPVCDHFFDGTSENRAQLEQIYAAFPECLFVEYPFIPDKIPSQTWKKIRKAAFWPSLSRYVGYSQLDKEAEHVVFLDADEVPDGKRFANWLDRGEYRQHTALRFSNYWYFRDASNQALAFEDSIVLAQRKALDQSILLHQNERDAIFSIPSGSKQRHISDAEGDPMFHHYSWVRTQEEMLKKVQTWSHREDRDWVQLVHQEFAAPFKGTDFVHGYSYRTVTPFFTEPVPFEPKGPPRITRFSHDELLDLIKVRKIRNFFGRIARKFSLQS